MRTASFLLLALALVDAAAAQEPRRDKFGDSLQAGAVARLGTVRLRHWGTVAVAAFSPDGKILASAGADGSIRLWDPATGRSLRTIPGHRGPIQALIFSASGKQLVSATVSCIADREVGPARDDDSMVVRLWDVATGKELRAFRGHETSIHSLACSRDGNLVISGATNGHVRIWELDREAAVHVLQPNQHYFPTHVALSPDDRLLATAGGDGVVRFFDPATGKEVRSVKAHREPITALAFTPDGKRFVTGGSFQDRTVKLWDTATGDLVRQVGEQFDNVSAFAFDPAGRLLYSGSVGHQTLQVWDLAAGKKLKTVWTRLPVPTGFRHLALSPDGKMLATVHGDHVVRLWDTRTCEPLPCPAGHTGIVYDVVFHPREKLLVTGGGDNTVRLWDFARGKHLHCCTEFNGPPLSLALSPDGTRLVAPAHFAGIGIFELPSFKVLGKTALWSRTFALAITPDGKELVTGNWDKHSLDFHDLATGKALRKLPVNASGGIGALAGSRDGKLLAAGGGWHADATIRVFERASGKALFSFKPHRQATRSLAFSPDGRLLASAGEGDRNRGDAVAVYSMKDGRLVARIGMENLPHEYPSIRPPRDVAFSPDGTVLAATFAAGPVRLYETSTWKEFRTLDGGQGGVHRVAFSPDGRLLATAGNDTTVLLWNIGDE